MIACTFELPRIEASAVHLEDALAVEYVWLRRAAAQAPRPLTPQPGIHQHLLMPVGGPLDRQVHEPIAFRASL